MADHKLELEDGTTANARLGSPAGDTPAEPTKYVVTAKEGLFKNGHLYKRGTLVPLAPETAARFIEAGEIKERDN